MNVLDSRSMIDENYKMDLSKIYKNSEEFEMI